MTSAIRLDPCTAARRTKPQTFLADLASISLFSTRYYSAWERNSGDLLFAAFLIGHTKQLYLTADNRFRSIVGANRGDPIALPYLPQD